MESFQAWAARIVLLVGTFLMFALSGTAQTGQETGQTAGPSPRPSLTRSHRLGDGSARDARNRFGFSIGILGFYDSNMFGSAQLKEAGAGASLVPRLFVNLGRKKSMLHLDYRFAYRRYPKRPEFDTRTHEAGVEYSYQASRRSHFSIRDHARSGPNDNFLLGSEGLIPLPSGESGPNQQVFFDRQRMTSNQLSGSWDYQTSRKNNFRISGRYQIDRFISHPEQDRDMYGARVQDEYQLTKRWSLSSEMASEWVDSTTGITNGRILRFLGGMKYRMGKYWEISGRSGADLDNSLANERTKAHYEASFARTSPSNRFGLRYSRSTDYQLGLSGLNEVDTAEIFVDQSLSRRLSVHLLTRYYRTNPHSLVGVLETMGGSAGFEYVLHPSLLFSATGQYVIQQQNGAALAINDLKTDRYLVYVGITYMFPSSRRQQRTGSTGMLP